MKLPILLAVKHAVLSLVPVMILFITPLRGGTDCGCSATGAFVDPDHGVGPKVNPDFSSPGGKYTLTVSGTSQFTLVIRLASSGSIVYQTTIPGGTWGFSPDDDRFVYTYLNSGVQTATLIDLSASPSRQVWSNAVSTSSSRLQFSPFGDYLMYNAITAPSHTYLNIIDARSGGAVYQTEFTFQAIPDSGETHGMATWGFSPDSSSRTFVYGWVSGTSNVQWRMINLESRDLILSRTITGISAFWQFSPCGDVLGLVEQTSVNQINASLYKTASIESPLASQAYTLADPVVMSTTNSSHIISIGGTPHTLASNTAATPCANELVSVTVPDSVMGGFEGAGTVRLSTAATGSAVVVTLSSNRPSAVTVPSSVTIPVGQRTRTFTFQTSVSMSDTPVVVTATAATITKRDTLILKAIKLQSLDLPDTITGGTTVYGSVTLNTIAPSGGIDVTLESDRRDVAPVPAGATVRSGSRYGYFVFSTSIVLDLTTVTITARSSFGEKSRGLVVRPAGLDSLHLGSLSLKGGNPTTLAVWLSGKAPPGGATVLFSSSDTAVAVIQDFVTVGVGAQTISVSVTTHGVASSVPVTFTASYRGVDVSAIMEVQPADLSSVVREACAVCGMTGGKSTDLTLNLDGEAPPGGALINLSSDTPALISTPSGVTIPSGSRSVSVTLATSAVLVSTTVRITAQYRAASRYADIVLGSADKYTITDLGVPAGYVGSMGLAINDSGAVIATAGVGPDATSFLWRNNQMTTFTPPTGYPPSARMMGRDINNSNHVIGGIQDYSNPRAFLWDGGTISLLPLPITFGWALNDSGWVISGEYIYKNGTMLSVGILSGETFSTLQAINNRGQVVGRSDSKAFIWENGTMSEILPIGGYQGGDVQDINDSGAVVGSLTPLGGGAMRAFVWRNGTMELLPMAPGGEQLHAYGINNRGEIVGDVIYPGVMKNLNGMIYRNGQSLDLNGLIPDSTRCKVWAANNINNQGYIVGGGMINGDSWSHAMLLSPPAGQPSAIGENEIRVHQFRLDQNYPNPFNPVTTIRYELPKMSKVLLKVYNVLGQAVATLVSKTEPAGIYAVQFNAASLGTGVYFYRLEAGTFVDVKKFLLVK